MDYISSLENLTYLNNSFSVNPDIIATIANDKIASPNDEWIFKYCARKLSPAIGIKKNKNPSTSYNWKRN